MNRREFCGTGILACIAQAAATQSAVDIRIDTAATIAPWSTAWAFFGYDEPNYTYMKNGRKLLAEIAALSPVPAYIRCHNLLTSGDGTPALKWGSTNAYTEDAEGRPVYDWKILDRIFDTYRETRTKPLVEIGFMPEALSIKPQPYRHTFPKGSISTGWAYPPKDYDKWSELIYQWARHAAARYGAKEVDTWYWEVWNEPDISYWRGTPEEYYRLYDSAAAGLKRALPAARIGGPHTTGPSNAKAAAYLRGFLEHCRKNNSPLDFIAFHAKGSPRFVDGHVRMGLQKHLADVESGFQVVASFSEFKNKPVIIGESDPEGCAACSARTNPANAYRNGPLYASYTAAMYSQTLELARKHGINLLGSVTWAFEFEDQPWFDGFRTLATNGVDKPVLNLFRMLGRMGGEQVKVDSTNTGVNAIASRRGREVSVLVWNYDADDVPRPATPVRVTLQGLPQRRMTLRHYRIDDRHSNAFTVWKEMGSPQNPTPEQYRRLEAAGQLQMVQQTASNGEVAFELPSQAVSLLQFGVR